MVECQCVNLYTLRTFTYVTRRNKVTGYTNSVISNSSDRSRYQSPPSRARSATAAAAYGRRFAFGDRVDRQAGRVYNEGV